jgi:chemotaxis protein CheX
MKHFPSEVKGEINTISLPSIVSASFAAEFSAESQSWLLLPCTEHVLDFSKVLNFELGICPAVVAFQRVLAANEKSLRSTNVSPSLMKTLVSAGVQNILGLVPKPVSTKIDVDFINPFLQSVVAILAAQTQTIFKPQKVRLQPAGELIDVGIIGIIPLNCSKFRGHVALCFPTSVFLKVYEKMLGEVHTEITAETEDAAGELLNMMYGNAKTQWNKAGFDFAPALPTILRGEKISVRQQTGGAVIVVPFESEVGIFRVEIATQAAAKPQIRSA